MDTAAASAWFAAHKTEALGVGAVAVAGLALLKRKRSGTASTSGVTAGAVAPGTIPAASVVGATADSSAFDAYNALQDEIGTLARNSDAARNTGATGSGVGAAVGGPVASTLLAPTGNGQLVRYGTAIGEVESDGSVYGLTLPEYQALGAPSNWVQLGATNASAPSMSTRASNLAAKIRGAQQPAPATPVNAATSGA